MPYLSSPLPKWCLGFVFTRNPDRVLLIKKGRSLHIGLWNGIGGKVEEEESFIDSMRRECTEEAGLDIRDWRSVCSLWGSDSNWTVAVYAAECYIDKMDILLVGKTIDELTASYQDEAPADVAYWVPLGEVSSLKLAPHTGMLIFAAFEHLISLTRPFDIMERED